MLDLRLVEVQLEAAELGKWVLTPRRVERFPRQILDRFWWLEETKWLAGWDRGMMYIPGELMAKESGLTRDSWSRAMTEGEIRERN